MPEWEGSGARFASYVSNWAKSATTYQQKANANIVDEPDSQAHGKASSCGHPTYRFVEKNVTCTDSKLNQPKPYSAKSIITKKEKTKFIVPVYLDHWTGSMQYLTIRLRAWVFYEQIVNEAQPCWLLLVENEGEWSNCFSINLQWSHCIKM